MTRDRPVMKTSSIRLILTPAKWFDHEAGFEARPAGLPCDKTNSNQWQHGWAEVVEEQTTETFTCRTLGSDVSFVSKICISGNVGKIIYEVNCRLNPPIWTDVPSEVSKLLGFGSLQQASCAVSSTSDLVGSVLTRLEFRSVNAQAHLRSDWL